VFCGLTVTRAAAGFWSLSQILLAYSWIQGTERYAFVKILHVTQSYN
jgi:hypothetical protein